MGRFYHRASPESGTSPWCTPSVPTSKAICRSWGLIGDIREAVFASKRVIATVEEIVEESVIRSDPNRRVIPGFAVSAVVRIETFAIAPPPQVAAPA